MKNFFGIIFIVAGVALLGGGIALLTNNETRSQTFGDRWNSTFNEDYRRQKEQQQMAGMAGAGGGAVLLILGIAMVAKKSKKTKRKEAELAAIKNLEAQKIKEKQLVAKAQAEGKERVKAQEKAETKTQKNPPPADESKSVSDTTVQNETFEGTKPAAEEAQDANPPTEDDLESKMSKIERLGELKEKGLLTDEEFAAEKKKILGN